MGFVAVSAAQCGQGRSVGLVLSIGKDEQADSTGKVAPRKAPRLVVKGQLANEAAPAVLTATGRAGCARTARLEHAQLSLPILSHYFMLLAAAHRLDGLSQRQTWCRNMEKTMEHLQAHMVGPWGRVALGAVGRFWAVCGYCSAIGLGKDFCPF